MSKEQGSESAVSRSQFTKEEEMAEEKEAPRKLSRREFVKGAAVGGAGVAAAGALASCAPATTPAPTTAPEATATTAPSAAPTAVPEKWDYETDVVVVGSGNGGMSAAVAAAKEGAKVIVVEISSITGGGSGWSGGVITSVVNTYDEYVGYTEGMHDPVLSRVFVESFAEYSPWLQEIGADVSPSPMLPGGMSLNMGTLEAPPFAPHCREYFDSLERILNEAGGTILLKTKGMKVLTDEKGGIVGLRAKGPEGFVDIKAKAVILSCGGFQNNPDLRAKYLGPDADLATILQCPYHTGDGMLMAQEVGASLRGSFSTFSSLWTSAFPATNPMEDPEDYEKRSLDGRLELFDLAFWAEPPGSILVNLSGKRFVDETEKLHRPPQAVIKQRRATAIVVFDEAMWTTLGPDVPSMMTGKTPREQLETIAKYGGVLVKADTIEELADELAKLVPHKVHKANLLKTIEEYNKAVEAGTTNELEVPRTARIAKLETPPFYGWPVRPAIYMCAGGVAIDEKAQVLDMQGEPIPRLYATPPVAGGIYREITMGGIGCAGTFGWIAGRDAAASL